MYTSGEFWSVAVEHFDLRSGGFFGGLKGSMKGSWGKDKAGQGRPKLDMKFEQFVVRALLHKSSQTNIISPHPERHCNLRAQHAMRPPREKAR